MRGPLRLRIVIPVAAGRARAARRQAAAHGRGRHDRARLPARRSTASTRALPGVHVRVLDGDRDFQVRVDPGVDAARARAR